MKRLNRKGIVALAAALLLVGAATAGAVATRGSTSGVNSNLKALASGDPDAASSSKDTPGEGQGPAAYAEQDYAHRAYPASTIPFSATQKAIAGWNRIMARSKQLWSSRSGGPTTGPSFSTTSWTSIGPNGELDPASLTFSGSPYAGSGRVTAIAVADTCTTANCRVWVAAAGGGIWRTDNALGSAGTQAWTQVSTSFATNAIGTLTYANGVLYAGTGEPNASGDSEAGLGIYKSTDGGDTWTHLASQVTSLTSSNCGASNASGVCTTFVSNGTYTGDAFAGRSIASIVVDPTNANVIYVASTRGVRGVSSVTGSTTSNPTTPRPPFGLFKSTDGGATFSYVWNGNNSLRGVNQITLDPFDANTVYAAAFQQGIWRSNDGGTTFTQIKAPVTLSDNSDRSSFAVAQKANGKTRMYVGDEGSVFRTEDAQAATPAWTNLTNSQNSGYCGTQCWYDNFVVSPPGRPNWVYLGGSFDYGSYSTHSDGRGVLLSTDAGQSWTDMTGDAQPNTPAANSCCNSNPVQGDILHPDQHALVTAPGNPGLFFEGSDGGLVRSQGGFQNISGQCASRPGQDNLALCQQLLSMVPTHLVSLNQGLGTLQFQSLSVNRFNVNNLMGGTQDNGTMQGMNFSNPSWPEILYGDGGLSGWNAGNSALRFASFYGQNHDANFQNGDPTKWVVIGAPIAQSPESSNFYAPIIADPNPAAAGTIFEGSQSVWRTQDWGGNQATLEANCQEFTTDPSNPASIGCGDFVQLGGAGLNTPSDLTGTFYGSDRTTCCVAWLARTPYPANTTDTGTLWAATNGGRVFISKNADNPVAAAVTWTRLDTLSAGCPAACAAPKRSITSISVDPANPNHAWISYTGYNFNTPSQPGHVFSVTYDPLGGTATWTSLDGTSLSDLPVTSVVYDSVTGDLYASTDFGVVRLPSGSSTWAAAAPGMPSGEVAGLTIMPKQRRLYAATHGQSAWVLQLP